MKILGVNWGHDASAALIEDGRVIFAIEEERLSRQKHDDRFPLQSVESALRFANIDFDELDLVAFGHNGAPQYALGDLRAFMLRKLPVTKRSLLNLTLIRARHVYQGNGRRYLRMRYQTKRVGMLDVDHHLAHAWSSYGLSGFDEALVLVVDGRGATQSTTLYHATGDRLRLLKTFYYPNSLGLFYLRFTDHLGFQGMADEWKVMGLAPYGTPNKDLGDVLAISARGYEFRMDASLTERYGPRRNPEALVQDDMDLAASVQAAFEKAMLMLVAEGVRLTHCRILCLAGGAALNSKANGILLQSGMIDAVFVQPAATDDGVAIGAALVAHQNLGLRVPRYRLEDVFLGPEYSDAEIKTVIESFKIPYTRVANPEEIAAENLAQGKIVGWFQGRMEFGPRALGNRSILADPRRPEMKDLVNASVKFREAWRPFAPSCLAEAADEYFEGCSDAPFMLLTFKVRAEKRSVIPAVTHVDNSARVQLVHQETSPLYWRLLHAFAERTGVPIVLNTSFNLRGEAIVCTPTDAIRTFYSSGLDTLVVGNYVISKS